MTRKRIGQNTGNSRPVNLSSPELGEFDATVGTAIKIDIALTKATARATSNKADPDKFVIVSKPASAPKVEYE